MTIRSIAATRISTPARILTAVSSILLVVSLAGCTAASSSPAVQVPKDFPTSVPVASGDVQAATKSGAAWSCTVKVGDAKAQQQALKSLKDKGYAVIGEASASGGSHTYSLSNGKFSVRLGYSTAKNGDHLVSYGVAASTSQPASPAPAEKK